ncbi:hypothetical protein V6N13_005730 [Hibiscus sabdariffa]
MASEQKSSVPFESSGIDGNAVTLSRDVVDEAVNVLVEVGTGVASSVLSQDPVLVVDKVLPRDNPFSILAEGQSSEASPRKSREAADGVPELMNQLKPKGKGGGGANKKRKGDMKIFFSAIYGSNGRDDRKKLWESLIRIKAMVGNCPWALAGDFNIIRGPQESSGFDSSQTVTGPIQDFLDCLDEIDVVDHAYSGAGFTWCNKREEAPLFRMLDRVLVNHCWLQEFPNAKVEFLVLDCSDHCPSHVLVEVPMRKPPRPFKFFHFWADHSDFYTIVENSWKLATEENPLQVLFTKLKRLKEPLKKLNRESYGGLHSRVLGLQDEFEKVQHMSLSCPNADLIAREKQISQELNDLLRAEEKFLRQKSRVQFIKEGDNNSAYFFRQVAARQSFNTVKVLHDMQGQKHDTFEGISAEFVRHFSEALGVVDPNVVPFSDEMLKEILELELTDVMQDHLVAPVTPKEIKDVLFAMNGMKRQIAWTGT